MVITQVNHQNQLPTQRRQDDAKGAKQEKTGISFAFFASLRLCAGNLDSDVSSYGLYAI
jgi:hypothetical protein